MPDTTTSTKKAVTLENLTALSAVLATKTGVQKQIEQAQLGGGGVEFATDEEVLALFQETAEPTE